MANSPKKKPSKKSAKPKAQSKKPSRSKIAAPRTKRAAATVKSSRKPSKNNSQKAEPKAKEKQRALVEKNHKGSKRLDPFVQGQRDKLLQLRDAMVDSMAGVAKDNLRSRAEGSEASAFGMHQADAGSDAYDRDFALSLLSQEQDALYEIDQALKRIEQGTYGRCEMSGKPIPRARLEAIPFARFTVECQSQLEKQNKASRVRQSVTSLFGLTEDEGTEGEEEETKADETKE